MSLHLSTFILNPGLYVLWNLMKIIKHIEMQPSDFSNVTVGHIPTQVKHLKKKRFLIRSIDDSCSAMLVSHRGKGWFIIFPAMVIITQCNDDTRTILSRVHIYKYCARINDILISLTGGRKQCPFFISSIKLQLKKHYGAQAIFFSPHIRSVCVSFNLLYAYYPFHLSSRSLGSGRDTNISRM